ncbi:unnamed protein product [Schistocephalus solidus]|uniref:50S ribosomal protein L25 n=1 Tax=Schistocephalus solidus TaxID=70667 RepID=A0A183T3X3_SCHSO|nr:unnamed protein product [Schistocephalus solidus]
MWGARALMVVVGSKAGLAAKMYAGAEVYIDGLLLRCARWCLTEPIRARKVIARRRSSRDGQHFCVWDIVLLLQLQYSADAADIEVIQLPGLARVAAPSKLHLPQHGVDAEDSGSLQDFCVQDPVLLSQLQYSAEAAEMEVIQLPALVRVDGPGIRTVKECRLDDGLVHLQFGVQVKTVAIPNRGLQPAEGL